MSTLNMGLVLEAIDVYKAGYIPVPSKYVNMSYADIRKAEDARSGEIAHNKVLFDELLAVVESNLVILDREPTVEEAADIKRIVNEGVSYEAVSDTVVFAWVLKQLGYSCSILVTPTLKRLSKFYMDAVLNS